jgi:phosphoserine phosphatase RsbU/P
LPNKGEVTELLGAGQAMGLTDRADFEASLQERQAVIPNGGSLLLFTSGVVESFDAQRQSFGLERLKQVFRANASRTSQGQLEAIMAAVHSHHGSGSLEDDQTVVVIRRGSL